MATPRKPGAKVGGFRPGAGRKPEIEGGTTKSIVFDDVCLRFMDQYVAKNKCSISKAVREMLKAGSWAVYKEEA